LHFDGHRADHGHPVAYATESPHVVRTMSNHSGAARPTTRQRPSE
jgi:hypothetical protein